MEKIKTVSQFEYAIMKAVHESDPTKVTAEELAKVRPLTDDEALEERKQNLRSQIERIKFK